MKYRYKSDGDRTAGSSSDSDGASESLLGHSKSQHLNVVGDNDENDGDSDNGVSRVASDSINSGINIGDADSDRTSRCEVSYNCEREMPSDAGAAGVENIKLGVMETMELLEEAQTSSASDGFHCLAGRTVLQRLARIFSCLLFCGNNRFRKVRNCALFVMLITRVQHQLRSSINKSRISMSLFDISISGRKHMNVVNVFVMIIKSLLGNNLDKYCNNISLNSIYSDGEYKLILIVIHSETIHM